MKTRKTIVYGLLAVILTLAFTACSGSGGGGKSLNSATELKEYLDKQPGISPDKPIKVAMKVNDMMLRDIVKVIKESNKYVSLDLSGSPLTTIPDSAFKDCKTLVGITIPNGVTSIGREAFSRCSSLASATIPNSVTSIGSDAFVDCTSLASITIPASVGLTRVTGEYYSVGYSAFLRWTASQTINIQGKANREATIAAGWINGWDDFCDAQIVYGK